MTRGLPWPRPPSACDAVRQHVSNARLLLTGTSLQIPFRLAAHDLTVREGALADSDPGNFQRAALSVSISVHKGRRLP